SDQTAVAVIKSLDGQLYLTALPNLKGGYDMATLEAIATLAKDQKVKHVLVEDDFGDGMFTALLNPVMARIYPCTIEGYKAGQVQKERRIIGDLEPVMNQHRLVIDSRVVQDDLKIAEDDPQYSLLYQLTHLTKERGSLRHEDKVEVVARGCRYFLQA